VTETKRMRRTRSFGNVGCYGAMGVADMESCGDRDLTRCLGTLEVRIEKNILKKENTRRHKI